MNQFAIYIAIIYKWIIYWTTPIGCAHIDRQAAQGVDYCAGGRLCGWVCDDLPDCTKQREWVSLLRPEQPETCLFRANQHQPYNSFTHHYIHAYTTYSFTLLCNILVTLLTKNIPSLLTILLMFLTQTPNFYSSYEPNFKWFLKHYLISDVLTIKQPVIFLY